MTNPATEGTDKVMDRETQCGPVSGKTEFIPQRQ